MAAQTIEQAGKTLGEKKGGDSFPWATDRPFQLTPRGEYLLDFPHECPLTLHFGQFAGGLRLTPNFHDFFELSLLCEGRGRFTVEERRYDVREGDLLVVGSREFHLLEGNPGNVMKIASIHFKPELVSVPGGSNLDLEYLRPFQYRTTTHSHIVASEKLSPKLVFDRIGKIYAALCGRSEGYALEVKTCLADILLEVCEHYRRRGGGLVPQEQRVRDFERLREVFNFTRKKCHEEIALDSVATMAHMSPNYFCRFFKSVTGVTFTEYVLKLRIDLATEYLADGSMTVTEIAHASGFSSHSYFDRTFKRFKGISPLKYRRQLKL